MTRGTHESCEIRIPAYRYRALCMLVWTTMRVRVSFDKLTKTAVVLDYRINYTTYKVYASFVSIARIHAHRERFILIKSVTLCVWVINIGRVQIKTT